MNYQQTYLNSLIGRSTSTKRNCRQSLKDFVKTTGAPLAEMTTASISKWFQHLEGRGVSNTFMLQHKANLASFLRWSCNGVAAVPPDKKAHFEKVLKSLDAILDIRPEAKEKKKLTLTLAHTEDILKAIAKALKEHPKSLSLYRDRAIYLLLRSSLLRCGELCSIKPSGLDFKENRLTVQGKGLGRGKVRTVWMSKAASNALQEWIKIGNIRFDDRIFSVTTDAIRKNLRKWLLRAGIDTPGISPHAFRHLGIDTMDKKGLPMAAMMSQSGHSELSSFQRYLHGSLGRKDFEKVGL